jgi:branched-chain amino acid transport system ATP-binding protein
VTSPLLEVAGLNLRFGGVAALTGVSFDIGPGELFAIIGPNGAGKTSIFNCITGVYRPQSGSIRLHGQELVGRRPVTIAAAGIARTFQNLGLFSRLDVVDNLMLGRHLAMRSGFGACAVRTRRARREEAAERARVGELVDRLRLGAYTGRPVGDLPYGVQKRIELGRALAMEPQLLLLDEPVAGMNQEETEEMADVILDASVAGTTMLLVEHDMHLVLDIADRVLVLDFGTPISCGTPEVVRADAAVIEAYLGAPIEVVP